MSQTIIWKEHRKAGFTPAFAFPPGTVRLEKPRITKRPTKAEPWWGITYRFTVLAGQSMLTQVEE